MKTEEQRVERWTDTVTWGHGRTSAPICVWGLFTLDISGNESLPTNKGPVCYQYTVVRLRHTFRNQGWHMHSLKGNMWHSTCLSRPRFHSKPSAFSSSLEGPCLSLCHITLSAGHLPHVLFLFFVHLHRFLAVALRASIFIAACWILSSGMWDLAPWPGIKPKPPALGVQSLSHWTSREVWSPLL